MAGSSPTLSEFVDKILEEKGLVDLEPDVQAQLKQDLEERLERQINATIVENLPDDKLEEFEAILDEKDDAAVELFVKSHIPDLDTKIAEAMLNFRNTYLS